MLEYRLKHFTIIKFIMDSDNNSSTNVDQSKVEQTNVEQTNVEQTNVEKARLVDIDVTDNNVAFNVMINFLTLAHKRGVFTIEESAKIWECIRMFQK